MKRLPFIKISFWILFSVITLLLYFVVRNNPQNNHLRSIPSQAENVIVIDLNELILSYKNLIEEDPSQLDSLFTNFIKDQEEDPDFEIPAVTPFQKVAIYFLSDDVQNIDLLLFCLEASSIEGLIKMVNRYEETVEFTDFEGGQIVYLKKSNLGFLQKGSTVVFVSPLALRFSNDEIDLALLKNQFKHHFGPEKKLADLNADFASIITTKNHVDYWKSNGSNLVDNIGGQILKLTNANFIRENHLMLNVKDEGLLFTTKMTFASDDVLRVKEDNTPLGLNANESFKFSASINPSMMSDVFEMLVPQQQQFLLKDWTGSMCMSVHGFDVVSLKQIRQPEMDTTGLLKPSSAQKSDTVPLNNNELLSYPMFQLSCELNINDITEFKKAIETNPMIKKEQDLFYYELPNILVERTDKSTKTSSIAVQRIYFYLKDNHLIFTPSSTIDGSFLPEYRTFSLAFSFDNLSKTYVPRNKIDFFAMSFIPTFDLESFSMNYVNAQGNKAELKGSFTLKNKDISHLLKLPLLMLKLSEIEFGDVLKAM